MCSSIFKILASGLALGGSIVIAQYFGAGKTDKIWQCTTTSTIFSVVVVSLFVPKTEAALADVLAVGSVYLRVVGAFLSVFTVFMLVKAVFKGSGDMGWFIFVTLLSFFIRLVLTVGFAHVFGVDIIWWAFCAGWIVATLVTIGRYLHGGWRDKSVV